jgi:putative membrane protein
MERNAVGGMNVSGRRTSWERLAGGLCGGLSGIALPMTAWAQERPWEWGWHPMWGMWGAWGFGMMLFMLVFWVLIIVGLVLGIRWLASLGRESRSDPALDILRQRYARGEINKDEFEVKKQDLGKA